MDLAVLFLKYFGLYIIILFGSMFIAEKQNKKIEKCIVIDFISIGLGMYLFGIFKIMEIGVWVITILSIIGGVYTIVKCKKENRIEELEKKIMSKGNLFFLVIYFVFVIFSYEKLLNAWDQFTYWSYACKAQFYSNQLLPFTEYSQAIVYPPIPGVIQYFFMKIIGQYSQGIEYFTSITLVFSILISIFDLKDNSKIENICKVIIIICLPAIFNTMNIYGSTYCDGILGLMMAYVIYLIFIKKNKNIDVITITLALSFLSLIKPTGFYIAGILIFIMIVRVILDNRKNFSIKEFLKKKEVKNIFIITIIVIITYGTWCLLIGNFNSTCAYMTQKDIESNDIQNEREKLGSIRFLVKSIFSMMYPTSSSGYTAGKINTDLFSKLCNLSVVYSPVAFSILEIFVILLFVGIALLGKTEEKEDYKKSFICIILFGVIYTMFLQVCYLLKFSEEEGLHHASFDRYISSYLLAFLIFCIIEFLKKNENNKKNIIYLTLAVVLITPIYTIIDNTIAVGITNANISSEERDIINNVQQIGKKIKNNEKIYFINQKILTGEAWKYKYYILPMKSEINHQYQYNQESSITLEMFKKMLIDGNFDYVYIITTDEYLNEFAKDLFENEISENTLYKIIERDNELKFEKQN